MHPGWVDTPGTHLSNSCSFFLLSQKPQIQLTARSIFSLFPAVSTSMPQFHRMMEDRLRTVEQGADTVVWLALSRVASRTRSGQFFQGKQHKMWRAPPYFLLTFSGQLKHRHRLAPPVLTAYMCCRSEACSHPPPSGLDSQFGWGDSEFHDSSGESIQRFSVASWRRSRWTL